MQGQVVLKEKQINLVPIIGHAKHGIVRCRYIKISTQKENVLKVEARRRLEIQDQKANQLPMHLRRQPRQQGSVSNVSHLQREVYWIVLLVMFFIEREVMVDAFFMLINVILTLTQ